LSKRDRRREIVSVRRRARAAPPPQHVIVLQLAQHARDDRGNALGILCQRERPIDGAKRIPVDLLHHEERVVQVEIVPHLIEERGRARGRVGPDDRAAGRAERERRAERNDHGRRDPSPHGKAPKRWTTPTEKDCDTRRTGSRPSRSSMPMRYDAVMPVRLSGLNAYESSPFAWRNCESGAKRTLINCFAYRTSAYGWSTHASSGTASDAASWPAPTRRVHRAVGASVATPRSKSCCEMSWPANRWRASVTVAPNSTPIAKSLRRAAAPRRRHSMPASSA